MPLSPNEVAFCLDPLTVLDCEAEETVRIAAATGCRWLSLWVQSPGPDFPVRCLVEPGEMAAGVRRTLAEAGVRPLNLEVFDLTPQANVAAYRGALEMGAQIGARCATAILRGHTDPQLMLAQFVALCQLAAEFDLRVNAEFISNQSLGSLAQAQELLARASQPNAGIVIDMLHLVRSGGTVEEVRQLDPSFIGHVQLCDGPATISPEARAIESRSNRMIPGEGDFPIRAFCEALPLLPLGLEVPSTSAAFQGLTPLERVRRLVQSTRRVMPRGAED